MDGRNNATVTVHRQQQDDQTQADQNLKNRKCRRIGGWDGSAGHGAKPGPPDLAIHFLVNDIIPGAAGTPDKERPEQKDEVDGQKPLRRYYWLAIQSGQEIPNDAWKIE